MATLDYLFFFALYPALGSYIVADLVVPRTMSPSTIALVLAAEILLVAGFYAAQAIGRRPGGGAVDGRVSPQERAVGWALLAFVFSFQLFPVLGSLPSLPQMERPFWLAGAAILFYALINRRLGRLETGVFVVAVVAKALLQLRGGLASHTILMCFIFAAVLFVCRRWLLLGCAIATATVLILSYVPIKQAHNWMEGRLATSAGGDMVVPDGPLSLNRSLVLGARRSVQGLLLEHVIEMTPAEIPYWNGSTLVNLLTNNIPRALWKDKPEERLGHQFASVYGLLDPADRITSWNVPWLVEFYMNFGRWGALACMATAGILIGLATRLLAGWPLTVRQIALTSAAILPLFHAESNVSVMAGNLIWVVVILLAAFYLADRLWGRFGCAEAKAVDA